MKQKFSIAVATSGMLLASSLGAQDTQQVVLGLYYKCDQGREARADEIVNEVFAPMLERSVSAGQIGAWGWNAHTMGGAWRRLLYMIGTDRDAMFDARAQMIEELQQNHAGEMEELGNICPSHDDYIWNVMVNSGGDAAPTGRASLSTYHACDLSRQGRADSLITQYFAPIYDRHVARGTIDSWGWLTHRFGGEWRRLATMSGSDAKSLLNAQDALMQELLAENALAWDEFQSICWTHEDYVWMSAVEPQ